MLAKDFHCNALRDKTRVVELGMYARQRDVLGFQLDKDPLVRCSKWSTSKLSEKQTRYAALDVIKPLEAYLELEKMPDLCQRLSPGLATVGVDVDIVPGRSRTSCTPTTRGHRVGDLATRGARGVICVDTTLQYDPSLGLQKNAVKIQSDKQRIVQINEVSAPMLNVPGHQIRGRDATLRDFGQTPFKILLPLTMLKNHVDDVDVRTFGEHDLHTKRRIKKPAISCKDDSTTSEKEQQQAFDALCRDEDEEEFEPAGIEQQILSIIEDDTVCGNVDSVVQSGQLADLVVDDDGHRDLMYCEHLTTSSQQFWAILFMPWTEQRYQQTMSTRSRTSWL